MSQYVDADLDRLDMQTVSGEQRLLLPCSTKLLYLSPAVTLVSILAFVQSIQEG
jgi:hypothetical protein